MREVLMVRFGEVHLKGLNRPYFLRTLVDHVKRAAKPYGGKVWMSEGRIYVRDMTDMRACLTAVTRVFGIHSVCPAIEMEKDSFEAICAQAVELMKPFSGTFKVKARRADKRFFPDSQGICAEVGGAILDALPGLKVDIHKPEHVLDVEIREMAYLYVERVPAVGGLPMGTNGHACLLLSGGIDSPVAGYMVAKRGVSLCCVHYHSHPYTSERAKEKVVELARILSEYCGQIKLFVVPFTDIQMKIHSDCPERYTTIIMRRYMMRIAEIIAKQNGAQALITGESIGQVASQTMEALACTDAVVRLPVFRPLIGFDKIEIIERAEKIGTMETSSLPFEDCCTIFTPRHPTTHPKMDQAEEAEVDLDMDAMIEAAVQGAECMILQG